MELRIAKAPSILSEGLAPSCRVNRMLILATAILAVGWVMVLYFEKEVWTAIIPPSAGSWRGAYDGFFIAITIALVVGAFVIRRRSWKPILSGGIALCLALTLALWLIPGANRLGIATCAMGAVGGLVLMAAGYLVIYGFGPGSRLVPCLIAVTGYFAIEAILALLSSSLPFDAIMALLAALLVLALASSLCIAPRHLDRLELIARRPFPFKTVGLFGAALCLLYASNNLIHDLAGEIGASLPFQSAWLLNWTPRFAVFGAVIALRRRADVAGLGYLTVLASIVLAACGLLDGLRSPLAFALLATVDGLGEFFIDTMIFDLARKYGRTPAVLVACMAMIALGTFAGQGLAAAVQGAAPRAEARGLAVFLCLNVLLLALLPLLYRILYAELGALPRGAQGVEAATTSASSAAHAAAGLIAGHFQGEYELTARELEIVDLLLERYDYRSIAERLSISVNTLKVHIRHIYAKCDVTSRRDLIDLARSLLPR